jgi:hypothetical protein
LSTLDKSLAKALYHAVAMCWSQENKSLVFAFQTRSDAFQGEAELRLMPAKVILHGVIICPQTGKL